jgi:uncharacterized protein (TIGR02271 family)
MTQTQTTTGRSAVVGVFRDRSEAEKAVEELKRAGFRDDQIGFVTRRDDGAGTAGTATDRDTAGTDRTTGAATGAVAGGVLGAVIGAGAALLIPGIGPVLAGGILAAALGGAAIGAAAGGLIGALTGLGIPEEEAEYYNTEFESGRTIVTVKADGRYQEAYDILHRFGAYDYRGREAMASAAGAAPVGAAMKTSTTKTSTTPSTRQQDQREIRVPEVEERLQVEKRPVQQGEVRIEREVHEEQKTVPVTLTQEEVHVEKRDVAERPLREGEEAFQEGTIRVPVRGEEAIARKEAVVTGEVVVNKERTTEQQQVADTVRRTEVHVDQDRMGETVAPAGQERVTAAGATAGSWAEAMPRYRGYWQSRYGNRGGRWEDYEPTYRYGWEMRNDPRYQGRNFDEVEADLQKDWARRYPSTPWDKAKAYVREAWTDAKSTV